MLATLTISGCGDDSDITEKQVNNIVAYLDKIVAQNPEEESYTEHDGVYRYILGSTLPEDQQTSDREVVDAGDSVSLRFAIHRFDTKPEAAPFFTNHEDLMPDDITEKWSTELLKLRIGDGKDLLPSVENALQGCLIGDSVYLFVPSNLGYGAKGNGIIAPNTALMYNITIKEVTNNR